jgi:hypothetical protein
MTIMMKRMMTTKETLEAAVLAREERSPCS